MNLVNLRIFRFPRAQLFCFSLKLIFVGTPGSGGYTIFYECLGRVESSIPWQPKLLSNAKSFIRCCKDKPIARGGPIKFRVPVFEKEKKMNREMSHLARAFHFDEINTLDVSQWMLLLLVPFFIQRVHKNISLIRNSAMGD